MHVLNLSLDKRVLEKGSAVQQRLTLLAEKAGKMTVLVPGERSELHAVSEYLTVCSVGGSRPMQLLRLWRLGKLAGQQEPLDLITVQDVYFLAFLGVRLSEFFKVPLEVQVHGLERFSGLRKRLALWAFRKATRIRVVSERLRKELRSRFMVPDSKMYVLPVYVQVEPPRAFKRKTVPYPFTFLTVGRLVPVKNIGMQIRAIAELARKIPHVRLQIVGEGPEEKSLKLKVKSEKLEDKVSFEGYQKDLGKYYEAADAFLLTSDSEGWGRVVLEAAAYKLPIIMTDVGLARETIVNGESGFIIKEGDEQELVLAMKDLVDDPALRDRLGNGARTAFLKLSGPAEQIERQANEWRSISREGKP